MILCVYINFHKICTILLFVLQSPDLRFILLFSILSKISILTTMAIHILSTYFYSGKNPLIPKVVSKAQV